MAIERIVVVADEVTTSDRPFVLARRLASAGGLGVHVVYGERDDGGRGGTPRWRVQQRLEAQGLEAATLCMVRAADPARAVTEHVAGHGASLILRGTAAGGYDGGPLLDVLAETIMSRVAQPLLLLGPHQVNPRPEDQLHPVIVRDGASDPTSLAGVSERWTATFPGSAVEVVDVLPPDPWPRAEVDRSGASRPDPRSTVTELRTLDPAAALLTYLAGRHDAVAVASSPRWPSTPSHWWATARRLVRRLPCPVLVVPIVEHPATGVLRTVTSPADEASRSRGSAGAAH